MFLEGRRLGTENSYDSNRDQSRSSLNVIAKRHYWHDGGVVRRRIASRSQKHFGISNEGVLQGGQNLDVCFKKKKVVRFLRPFLLWFAFSLSSPFWAKMGNLLWEGR